MRRVLVQLPVFAAILFFTAGVSGGWIFTDVNITMKQHNPRMTIKGISTMSFVRNMETMINYLKNIQQK